MYSGTFASTLQFVPAGAILPRMSSRRLFCPQLSVGPFALDDAEAHHARSVLRLKEGEPVILLDGKGGAAEARIDRITRREVFVNANASTQHPFDAPRHVTLAVALPRRHRQSYLVEKCTELGAAGIWLIDVERQVSKPDDETAGRFVRRAAEALKQCGRYWMPDIAGPMTLSEAIKSDGKFDAVGLLHPSAEARTMGDFLAEPATRLLFLIGPEGGWSHDDVQTALNSGAAPVRLGEIILRTETAAVAACALATLGR